MSAPTFRDYRNREVHLYRENNNVAIDTVQPKLGAHTGDPLQDNTFHEVFIGGEDLDRLIFELTKLRDAIIADPTKETTA